MPRAGTGHSRHRRYATDSTRNSHAIQVGRPRLHGCHRIHVQQPDQQHDWFRASGPFKPNRECLVLEFIERHKMMQPGNSGKQRRLRAFLLLCELPDIYRPANAHCGRGDSGPCSSSFPLSSSNPPRHESPNSRNTGNTKVIPTHTPKQACARITCGLPTNHKLSGQTISKARFQFEILQHIYRQLPYGRVIALPIIPDSLRSGGHAALPWQISCAKGRKSIRSVSHRLASGILP